MKEGEGEMVTRQGINELLVAIAIAGPWKTNITTMSDGWPLDRPKND